MQLEIVQRKSKSMSLFVTPNNSLKSKTTSAETQFCNFIAEHNIPFEEQTGPDKDLFLPVDICRNDLTFLL
jgi:hypothetical protein